MVAMGERYWEEIASVDQVKEAGTVIYLTEDLIREAKNYALFLSLKKRE